MSNPRLPAHKRHDASSSLLQDGTVREHKVRIEHAINATVPEVVSLDAATAAHSASTSTTTLVPPSLPLARPPHTTYHDTGTNTPRLPASCSHFHSIHGRQPTTHDFQRPPIQRFTRAVEPHEVAYGPIYLAPSSPPPAEDGVAGKGQYAESGFQTDDFAARRISIIKARLRASMLVGRYGTIAAREGWKVQAESQDNRVLHSEQFPCRLRFDSAGNIAPGVAMSYAGFLPNIVKRELSVEPAAEHSHQKHTKAGKKAGEALSSRDSARQVQTRAKHADNTDEEDGGERRRGDQHRSRISSRSQSKLAFDSVKSSSSSSSSRRTKDRERQHDREDRRKRNRHDSDTGDDRTDNRKGGSSRRKEPRRK